MNNMHQIYEELLKLVSEGKEQKIKKKLKTLIDGGLLVKVASEDESEFYEDGHQSYTDTTQENKLYFNDEIVYEWWASYNGFWGGGGTGWWINEEDSDLDAVHADLLEYLDIEIKTPDVPRPPVKRDEDE
jgi:hypothetical protein